MRDCRCLNIEHILIGLNITLRTHDQILEYILPPYIPFYMYSVWSSINLEESMRHSLQER